MNGDENYSELQIAIPCAELALAKLDLFDLHKARARSQGMRLTAVLWARNGHLDMVFPDAVLLLFHDLRAQ